MKRIIKFVGGLLGLVALVVGIAMLMRTATPMIAGHSPLGTPEVQQSLVCLPELRPSNQSAPAVLQPIPTPDITTPLQQVTSQLERGPRVGFPALLATSSQQAAIRSQVALHHKLLIISVTDAQGWTCLFISDINGKRPEQIATLRGMLEELVVSDQYLVWVDKVYIVDSPESGRTSESPASTREISPQQPGAQHAVDASISTHTYIHVYDLRARREVAQYEAERRFFDLANDVLVWQEYRGTTWGVYGQNLATGQMFTVTNESASYPRVGGDWIAYVGSRESVNRLAVDLHLFNWRTGEEMLIGPVSNDPGGKGYDIDEESLAWVKVQADRQGFPSYELHIYNLATGNDRRLETGNGEYLGNLHLSDHLLIYAQSGWQAADPQTELMFTIFPSPAALESIPMLGVSNNRLVWGERDALSGAIHLYTAQINRKEGE